MRQKKKKLDRRPDTIDRRRKTGNTRKETGTLFKKCIGETGIKRKET